MRQQEREGGSQDGGNKELGESGYLLARDVFRVGDR